MNVDNSVLSVLENCKMAGRNLFLPQHLDRKMYLRINTVLEAAGENME